VRKGGRDKRNGAPSSSICAATCNVRCYLNYDVQSSPHLLQPVVHHTTVTGYVIALTRE
jgi:hypothetical protein